MPRLFVALDLSIAVVERLIQMQDQLQVHIQEQFQGTTIKWVAPENIHATIKYIGEVEEALVPLIEQTLLGIAQPLFPFQVKSKGVGCFPDSETPRVLWSGLDQSGAEVLTLLNQMVERELGHLGLPEDQYEYRPHITLGRVKSKAKPNFTALIDPYVEQVQGTSTIKDLILYESQLGPRGPQYLVRKRFALGGR